MLATQQAVDARIRCLEQRLAEMAREALARQESPFYVDSDYPRRQSSFVHRSELELKLLKQGVTNYYPHADGFLVDGVLLITVNHKYRRLPKHEWKRVWGCYDTFIDNYIKPYHVWDVANANPQLVFRSHHLCLKSWRGRRDVYV